MDGEIRQLKPSKEVAERMDEVKNLLGWDEFVWVGVHVMNPSLVFEVPHPKPRMVRPFPAHSSMTMKGLCIVSLISCSLIPVGAFLWFQRV